MTSYEFVNILREAILDITAGGTIPVVKIGDKILQCPSKKRCIILSSNVLGWNPYARTQ